MAPPTGESHPEALRPRRGPADRDQPAPARTGREDQHQQPATTRQSPNKNERAHMMRIIGIDPSLTATGIAVTDTTTGSIYTDTITTKNSGNGIHERLIRFGAIGARLIDHLPNHQALAVIEGPAYASNGAGTWDRAGLWWTITRVLDAYEIPTIEVPPATRARYATGRGNASKDEVLIAAVRRYPQADITDNNQADAVILAAIGARLTGAPIDTLPKTHTSALTKLTAPIGLDDAYEVTA